MFGTEDFTTYTEVDPGSDLVVTSDIITITAMPCNVDSYIYKDFGADYWTSFSISFQVKWDGDTGEQPYFYGPSFADSVGSLKGSTGKKIVTRFSIYNTSLMVSLHVMDGIYDYSYDYKMTTGPVDLYCVMTHAQGSNLAYLYIYTDAAMTQLLDTLAINHAYVNHSFRYLYAMSSYNSGSAYDGTGYVKDLHDNDIDESSWGGSWG